jgi:aconitate hydratase
VEPIFSSTLELDLSTVVPSLAGPKRPQDRVSLPDVDDVFNADMANVYKKTQARVPVEGKDFDIGDGDVTIAAITSCLPNTRNPGVLVAAGLVAKKADAYGLEAEAVGQDSLAPGSQVVTDYLKGRASEASRQYRLQPRRLWLHHLYRQLPACLPN